MGLFWAIGVTDEKSFKGTTGRTRLDQAKLAEELDVSRQTINAIETGKFDPSLPLAFKAARLFDMLIEDIFQDKVDS